MTTASPAGTALNLMGANSYGQAADGTLTVKSRWSSYAKGAKMAEEA